MSMFGKITGMTMQLRMIFPSNFSKFTTMAHCLPSNFHFRFSTYSRKRPHSHSPPLRSPEPLAKKVCSRPTPPASPVTTSRASRRAMNGVSNGHTNGNSAPAAAAPQEVEMEEPAAERTSGRRSGSRRGGSSSRDTSESRTPPTRSSARLRSSRK